MQDSLYEGDETASNGKRKSQFGDTEVLSDCAVPQRPCYPCCLPQHASICMQVEVYTGEDQITALIRDAA